MDDPDTKERCEDAGTCPLGTPREAWHILQAVSKATLDIARIANAIYGTNGEPGLIRRVERLRWQMTVVTATGWLVLTAVVAGVVRLWVG